ncbi:hypothetical protein CPC08DRAFT_709389 [Agrocybe pediades]|nr:hypothetical protein CPC08DRAFT_709389 [Agrocybe pediades]
MSYFQYLYCIKDVSESTRLLYREQMCQYCEGVLAVLDDNLPSNLEAHFVFAYYHLLQDRLPQKFSNFDLKYDLNMDDDTFGDIISDVVVTQSCDITRICNDLIGDSTKKEAIFAKSAAFCLALLCDQQHASREAGPIYRIAKHYRHKMREHPWHWRRMAPRLPFLGNRLALIAYPEYWSNTEHARPQQLHAHIHLLDLLPYVLPLAGRYEPLLDLCMKKCFSSLSQFCVPKKIRRARQAIESYLHREGALYQDLESRVRLFRTSSQLLKTSPDLLTAWAVPEQAAAFIQGIREVVLDSILASYQIGPSQYALYVGFDHLSLQHGFGYMQQIHIFTSVDVSNTSKLIPELGKLFLPFSSMIFTPSMCMRLPVFKGDGTEWEFDDYAESMATRWSDRGETGSFNPTIVDLSLETRSNNTEGGVQDEEQAAPSGDDDGLSSKVPSREGDDRKDKKDQMDRSDRRMPGDGGGDGSSEGGGGGGGSGYGGGGGGGDNSGNEAPAGPSFVSYKVTSNLYSDKKKEVFQILKSEGDIAYK